MLGECKFGANDGYLCFVAVKFEKMGGEPGFDFLKAGTEGGGWEGG